MGLENALSWMRAQRQREGGLESALSGRRGLESTLRKREIGLESTLSKG
jgi:hypothetical protein